MYVCLLSPQCFLLDEPPMYVSHQGYTTQWQTNAQRIIERQTRYGWTKIAILAGKCKYAQKTRQVAGKLNKQLCEKIKPKSAYFKRNWQPSNRLCTTTLVAENISRCTLSCLECSAHQNSINIGSKISCDDKKDHTMPQFWRPHLRCRHCISPSHYQILHSDGHAWSW